MNHKQKIGYTIFGAFIMLIGMSIDNLTSSPVTAQNDGEITCQKLTFVDETGKPLFYLETGNGLSIFKADVFNWDTEVSQNKEVMRLTCDGIFGNELSLLNPEGREGVRLDASQFGNFVAIFNHEGKEAVSLASTNGRKSGVDINSVGIFNHEGEAVTLKARMRNAAWYAEASPIDPIERKLTSESNSVYVYNNAPTSFIFRDGSTRRRAKAAVSLVSDENGNKVTVYNKVPKVVKQADIGSAGLPAVKLGDTEYGGRVNVLNKQGENRAVMSVNEFGNGAVSTWDKNGYRQ